MSIITTSVRNRTLQSEFKELHSLVNLSFDIGLICQISSTIGGKGGQFIHKAGFRCNRIAFLIPEIGTTSID
jgi:hypothetical protein